MKNFKTKLKQLWSDRYRIALYALVATLSMGVAISQAKEPLRDMMTIQPLVIIRTVEVKPQMELLRYNERVPAELVKKEIKSLSERFGLDEALFNRIVKCESGYNNIAKNPDSTALGVSQYLIGTWQETESFKQHKKARTDYKASLWEMALDISSGESWRWEESKHCWK